MSIDKIKDVNTLKSLLNSSIEKNKCLEQYIQQAGELLAKNLDYDWDEKPKNLTLYASALNEKYETVLKRKNYYKKKYRKNRQNRIELQKRLDNM